MNYVLSLDPGGTTGWALSVYDSTTPLRFIDGGQVEGGVIGFVEWVPTDLYETLRHHGVPDGKLTIVSESFHIRPRVHNPDVTPLRIEGAMTAMFGPAGVYYQRPAKKALVPDEKLREVGLWIPGQRHQMDARIHALAYMAGIYHLPTMNEYWNGAKVLDPTW